MSAFIENLPFILYACPFVVAAIVLIRAWMRDRFFQNDPEVTTKVTFPEPDDDPLVEEVRSRPIYRGYVRYGI